MNKPKWMQQTSPYPNGLAAIGYEDGWKHGQKKLLEHLIAQSKIFCIAIDREDYYVWGINTEILETMLKQQEESK